MMETKVEVVESTLVAPSEETPRSNLDNVAHAFALLLPPGATRREDFFSPCWLKAALARALVLFYPLAGRLGMDECGRLQIDCNGKGALFVVARADYAGEDLFTDYVPSPELSLALVPLAPSSDTPSWPMVMFLVTNA